MGLLARTTLAALLASATSCYSPELRDCTVTCSGLGDCASGQVCGSDHMCAAPSIAGHCASSGQPGDDAGPPDAPTHGLLTIYVGGHGSVAVGELGRCDYTAQPCELRVPLDAESVMLDATGWDDWQFEAWDMGPCTGSTETSCTFLPSLTMIAGAKFAKDVK